MSQEAPKVGLLVEMATPEIPRSAFDLLRAETENIGDGNIRAMSAEEIMNGIDSDGDKLFALGGIIYKRRQGYDVILIHNPEDEIVLPNNILAMGTESGDDDE